MPEIILEEYADASCRKCYGRGFMGTLKDGEPNICACVWRNYRRGRKTTVILSPDRKVRTDRPVDGNTKLSEILE